MLLLPVKSTDVAEVIVDQGVAAMDAAALSAGERTGGEGLAPVEHTAQLKGLDQVIVEDAAMVIKLDAAKVGAQAMDGAEELVEQLTWQQLGRHSKPIMLANVDGFWEPLLALLAHMRDTAFIRPTLAVNVLQADRVEDILPKLRIAASGTLDSKHMPADVADRL